jgi:hypothetical protein
LDTLQLSWLNKANNNLLFTSALHLYVRSIYYITVTISTIGYGDIVPVETAETWFIIIVVAGGVVINYSMLALIR